MTSGLDGIIGIIPTVVATVAVVHVIKAFQNPKTGVKEEYSLHGTYDSQAEAKAEAKLVRADGDKARVTKSGSKYKVWSLEGGSKESSSEGGFSFW